MASKRERKGRRHTAARAHTARPRRPGGVTKFSMWRSDRKRCALLFYRWSRARRHRNGHAIDGDAKQHVRYPSLHRRCCEHRHRLAQASISAPISAGVDIGTD
ncbi:hypothetical protein EVAR_55195_1 [Eumeta japonica]|uniref:Uncharacterized protein n=1 Tax=Eumeta variegata TaxID=151549 RepID=A0A4C1ZEB5_EUMVA|nr:hypothetical protein EVAR_55195_1 [Eumeta japonica]